MTFAEALAALEAAHERYTAERSEAALLAYLAAFDRLREIHDAEVLTRSTERRDRARLATTKRENET